MERTVSLKLGLHCSFSLASRMNGNDCLGGSFVRSPTVLENQPEHRTIKSRVSTSIT